MAQRRWFPPPRQVWHGLRILPHAPPLWWWKGAYLLTDLLTYFYLTYPGHPLPPIPVGGGPSTRVTGPYI